MKALIDYKQPRPRFARSINVERDAGGSAVDGYLPVGRAIDAISRLAVAMQTSEGETAISITGPYGSGKSSLAIVVDALLGPDGDDARSSAEELLAHTAPSALTSLQLARERMSAPKSGFIRAVVTAQREPIAATALRALHHGAERYEPTGKQRARLEKVKRRLAELHATFGDEGSTRPGTREVREVVTDLAGVAPVLLLIDEFGKNLEAFADSHSDADLFLLQELAEWTRGAAGIPLALVTLQHMAFDEYADGASATQRREWLKIQGRFEDIPFVDSPAQTRSLIAAAFEPCAPAIAKKVAAWAHQQAEQLKLLGLNELGAQESVVADCWPLHPLALLALPELCERYGQNERTLFSFLAGHEPLSVASFLRSELWGPGKDLPVARLDRVYDYFLESATGMAGISNAASRWVEIDTRIRDAHGLSPAARRVLKTVGLLNLISAGGVLRASKETLVYATVDGEPGSMNRADIEDRLAELESAGLLTFRDFADEYRVWQGSDFDLKAALDVARRRLRDVPPADILNRVLPLAPLVAGRHSHERGVLRAFARGWIDQSAAEIDPLGPDNRADGLALYVLGPEAPKEVVIRRAHAKPVVFFTVPDPSSLILAARELASLEEVLGSDEDLGSDWVAQRELIERRVEAQNSVVREFERIYGSSASEPGEWCFTLGVLERSWDGHLTSVTASRALSAIADAWYDKSPTIRNDLVNRHELSSQASKARRLLIEAMLSDADKADLGITGWGPDRTMYLSVLHSLGLHHVVNGVGAFCAPGKTSSVRPAWDQLTKSLRQSSARRLRVTDIYEQLAAPPFGVRAGVAPILVVAALSVLADEVALYEHGTFRPVLTNDVAERLLRNPANFEVKHFASRTGRRADLLNACIDKLGVTTRRSAKNARVGSVLAVLSHLVAMMNTLPEFSKKTLTVSPQTAAVRRALLLATEPDELLFRAIPEALGREPVATDSSASAEDIDDLALMLQSVVTELTGAYPRLLSEIRHAVVEELRGSPDRLRDLAARARDLQGQLIDQRLARFAVALGADLEGDDEWAEYVGMNVVGSPPASWSDEDRNRFLTSLADIGSTFRRIEALHADVRSRGEGFHSLRVTVTRADGAETARLVWVDESRRESLAEVVAHALTKVRGLVDTDAEARDVLLALLAQDELMAPAVSQAGPTGLSEPNKQDPEWREAESQ